MSTAITSNAVERVAETCFLLRGLLSTTEQCALFDYIDERDCTPWDTLPRAMVPAPKTLMFGAGKPMLSLALDHDKSPATYMVNRTHENVLGRGQFETPNHCGNLLRSAAGECEVSMAVIRYEAPDGRFPPHVDHCDGSLVYLMTLGCTAQFMVKTPDMEEGRTFDLESGDMLVFDASTKGEYKYKQCVTGDQLMKR
jgi:hypothetical protein